ncbi:MAG: CDC27 family protein [Chitinophagales bacterium]|nr:CDC27 family protein [Chitinophagales bacterium]
MSPEKDSNLILRFFSRELEAEERNAFEQKINEDPSFVKKFKAYRQVKGMVDQAYDDGYKAEQITRWKDDLRTYKSKKLYRRLMVAAGLSIAIIACFFLLSDDFSFIEKEEPISPIALAQEAWPISPTLNYSNNRSTEDSPDAYYRSLLTESFDDYSSGAYSDAIMVLDTFAVGIPYLEDAQLLRGLSLYALGQKEEALIEMEAIIQSEKDRKKGHALWYAALIHLELEEVEQARSYLERILTDQYATSTQAEKILEKIEGS